MASGKREKDLIVSIVIPVYNEHDNLECLYKKIIGKLSCIIEHFEIIFVDDGSTDVTLQLLQDLSKKDPAVRYISLSRNFGHQIALFAGLEAARGNAVISMDGDLQHPPELLPEMISKWQQGYQVVIPLKKDVKVLPLLKRWFASGFYAVVRRISKLKLHFGSSDFRLLDRVVVNALKSMPEKRKFLRGLVDWTGYKTVYIPFKLVERYAGKPKYTYAKMFQLAFDAIFSFSLTPLRVVFWIGVFTSMFCFLYAIFITIVILFDIRSLLYKGIIVPGWLSIMVGILFLGGVQLISIGILGEYIGRIYEESRDRPLYLIKETSENNPESKI